MYYVFLVFNLCDFAVMYVARINLKAQKQTAQYKIRQKNRSGSWNANCCSKPVTLTVVNGHRDRGSHFFQIVSLTVRISACCFKRRQLTWYIFHKSYNGCKQLRSRESPTFKRWRLSAIMFFIFIFIFSMKLWYGVLFSSSYFVG